MNGFLKSPPRRLLQTLLCTATLLVAGTAGATNYTLWIHGRNPSKSTAPGNYNDFSYWGPATTAAGVNKKAVNWDGYSSVSSQNGWIRNALDCFCTGTNWCTIAVHSAGDLQLGYALAQYGNTARTKTNAVANTSGVCGALTGTGSGTQNGWNIREVYAASGASGGSELADLGSWAISEPLTKDLVTTTSRAMYDHNQTRGLKVRRYAGAAGTVYSALLPGQDDEAVSYHSSGGVSGTAGASFGNPSDWFSNDLNTGTAACEGGATKWTNNTLDFRDDKEQYNHYANGNWQGIISPTRAAVATYSY